jgi:hypothetical protein
MHSRNIMKFVVLELAVILYILKQVDRGLQTAGGYTSDKD